MTLLEKFKKVVVFGPHDRMNYGDFLFPLMLDFAFSKKTKEKICFDKYSLISSDFRSIGAFRSNNYKYLKKNIQNEKIDVIIMSGGESLLAKWSNLYSYINPIYDYFYQHPKLKNSRIFRNIPKFILGGKTEYPFLIDKNNFTRDFKVIYNAVGGGYGLKENQIEILRNSDLCALRENMSYSYIKDKYKDVSLVPDSAIILSDVYELATPQIKRLEKEKYIIFQISNHKHQNCLNEVCSQLIDILNNFDYKIILCPIGTAKGHEDHIALNYILNNINHPNITLFSENPKINEIISLIAHSEIYIGTSLHGIITSMSYGVPYIGLNPTQTKLKAYVETWGIEELKNIYNTFAFYDECANIIQSLPLTEKIKKKTIEQKEIYYDFITKMIEIIDQP
ncbi:Polysaccharide pyruvyl transferase [compost metagenome]